MKPDNDIERDVSRRPDPEVARDAVAAIESELPYSWGSIEVIVDDGWLRLEGEVEWNYSRQKAEEAVQRVRGVRGFTNAIKLRPCAAPIEIKRKIEEAFRRSAQADACRIEVDTNGGAAIPGGAMRFWAERQVSERTG